MSRYPFIKNVLYSLKRRYGQSLTINGETTQTTNFSTGAVTLTDRNSVSTKAIVLPSRLLRSFSYDLTYIAANKNFTYGAQFDKSERQVIVDNSVLTFELTLNCTVTFNSKTYKIEEIMDFEEARAKVLTIVEDKGQSS